MEVIAIVVFVVVIRTYNQRKGEQRGSRTSRHMALVVTGVMSGHRALSLHRFQYYWSASGHDGARCHNKGSQGYSVCN